MKYCQSSSSGLVEQEMKSEAMKIWDYSLNACCDIVADLESMQDKEKTYDELHKKNLKSHIAHNKTDIDNIRYTLETSINVFDFNHRPETDLINIATEKNYPWNNYLYFGC